MNVKKQAPYPLDRKSSVQNIKKKYQVSASGGKLTQFFYLKISQVRQKKQMYFNVAGSGFPPLDALYTPPRVVTNSGEQRSELDHYPCPWEMVSRDCITGTPLLSGFPLGLATEKSGQKIGRRSIYCMFPHCQVIVWQWLGCISLPNATDPDG